MAALKKARRTIAEGDDQPSPPVYFKTLTQAQCDYFAKWVVERLSNWMAGEEILNVLKRARMQAASVRDVPPSEALIAGGRKRGKPGKWRGAHGIQMVREVETLRELCPNMTKREAIANCIDTLWLKRFGENTDLERRYFEAEKFYNSRR